jgi:hypothetical protein
MAAEAADLTRHGSEGNLQQKIRDMRRPGLMND